MSLMTTTISPRQQLDDKLEQLESDICQEATTSPSQQQAGGHGTNNPSADRQYLLQ
jgi:hypothetical protein